MENPIIQKIESKNFTWIDLSRCADEEIKYLEENFDFSALHLGDCISKIQRPKLDLAEKYIFMVLLFPVYNRKTRKISSSEVDFFINSEKLITVHHGEIPALINFFNLCKVNQLTQEEYFKDPLTLLFEILNRLFTYCIPIMNILNINISSIEENIFQGYEKRMVKEILIAKSNIINFRKIMQAHRMVISKLTKKINIFFPDTGKFKEHFNELLETTEDIWENLENLRQSINGVESTNNSLISFQLNDVIKILTTISVIILPISLIASIFGMNLQFIPFANQPFAFWLVIAIMVLTFAILISYFKRKKWL